MRLISRFRSWLHASRHRSRIERDMDDELRFHIDRCSEDLVRSGVSPQEASRRARAEFGGFEARKEEMREALGLRLIDELRGDLCYAFRQLRRSPAFATMAVLSLAIGIGANTTIFTILNSVAFRTLPVPGGNRLLSISQSLDEPSRRARRIRFERSWFSYDEYQAYRNASRAMSGLLAYAPNITATLGGDEPRLLVGALTSCNFFDVLQVRPAMGRGFQTSDCTAAGANAVVVLSDQVWRTALDADPMAVGHAVTLNRTVFTVVGVTPPGFAPTGPIAAAFWAPLTMQHTFEPDSALLADDQSSWLSMLGRPRDEVSMAQVRADLGLIAAQLDARQGDRKTTLTIRTATMFDMPQLQTNAIGLGSLLLAAVGLVLLIACANVANMLLARSMSRRREIAVRLAIGANRARLVRQLLTESALLAGIGGLLGLLLASWSSGPLIRILLSYLPIQLPVLTLATGPDVRVMAYGALVTALTALACGLAPALRASRPDLTVELKQECGDLSDHSKTARLWRDGLLGAQVVASMVLLLTTGLLIRGLYQAETIDPGFRTNDIVVANYDLTGAGYDARRAEAFQRQLTDRLSALPGVTTAVARGTPLRETLGGGFILDDGTMYFGDWNAVSASYFSMLGIPIVRGRSFTPDDERLGSNVVIVTESTARRFWPGSNPIGQTLVRRGPNGRRDVEEVIGIAKDAQVSQLAESDKNFVYFPVGPEQQAGLRLLVHRTGDRTRLVDEVRAAIHTLDPQLFVGVAPLEDNVELWRTVSRVAVSASAALGLVALALAAIGAYGVVAYTVSRRAREIGIRVALGATRREVIWLVLRQTMRPVVGGALVGAIGAAAVSRVLSGLLYGVSPYDPLSFVLVPIFLLAIAGIASYLPARHAARVDPLIALRYE